jgi:RNA polymerase primary sigma factor
MEAAARVVREVNRYEQELGRAATLTEIARALDLPIDRIEHSLKIISEPISLDGSASEHTETPLLDLIVDQVDHDPARQAINSCVLEKIQDVLSTLTPREQTVVSLRFGFFDGHARTLNEVAGALDITRERVRQIEQRGLRKLKEPCRALVLRNLLVEAG